MNTFLPVLGAILLLSGVELKNKDHSYFDFQATGKIATELEAKTGVRLRFILDKDVLLTKSYMEKTAGKSLDNQVVVILDEKSNRIYKFQGKNTREALDPGFFSFVLENELRGAGSLQNRVASAAAILAKNISNNKKMPVPYLENIYVKPVDSFFYRLTGMWPLKYFVKAFYYNMLLFISVFPIVTWYMFVKVPELFLGETAGETGKKAWKVFLFIIFCVIITRVGTDFNLLIGTTAATLVVFMPFVAIAAAVYKEEITSLTVKFFGWEE